MRSSYVRAIIAGGILVLSVAPRAAARGPLAKAKETLSHAEAEHKRAGADVKKHAEAVREARLAQGYAEEARLIAERL